MSEISALLFIGGTMTEASTQSPPALSYGDVMVLVRRRGQHVRRRHPVSLKHAGVPVAGRDRLKLTEHIASRPDECRRRLLLPQTILRSPSP